MREVKKICEGLFADEYDAGPILGPLIGVSVLFVLLVIGVTLALGFLEINCTKPMKRIEYVIPSHRIGCWLGEAVGE